MAVQMTILSTWLDAVVDQLELQNLDARQLTEGLWGPGQARLAPTRHVGLVLARRLWQRAASLSTDPLLGLKVGIGLPLQAMNITGLLMMHSPSLREALANMERYQQLVSNSGRLSVHPLPGGLELRYAVTPCHVAMHPMQIDSVFGGLLAFLRRCCSRDIAPQHLVLTAPDARLAPRYAALLGVPVTLAAPGVRVVYTHQALAQPFQGADPALLGLVRAQADGLLRSLNSSESLEAAVRAALGSLGFRGLDCSGLARSLGLSPRTLQRRLRDSGMPFRRMLEAARMEEALRLLTQGSMPLPDIADHLGYAEPSSFWHAVKTCWGATPKELRSRAGAGSVAAPERSITT
ncbi:MAG: AraC family transcriptional regulator ligand-binding domain-containing protein [Pseudomonadota bacterium]